MRYQIHIDALSTLHHKVDVWLEQIGICVEREPWRPTALSQPSGIPYVADVGADLSRMWKQPMCRYSRVSDYLKEANW